MITPLDNSDLQLGDAIIAPGTTRDVRLSISESYAGDPVHVPVRVIRAHEPGPVVLLTAAVHGNEINGTGILRELIFDSPLQLQRGTVICAPLVNVFGFEHRSRYMPDGRDLNRCFPGFANGSLASRYAHIIMEELIENCHYAIDIHSAADTRTNYPNIRGDLRHQKVAEIAEAFGCELMVNGRGPVGSFRRAATDSGRPTILLEAGEVNKMQPGIMAVGVRGIRNVLIHLNMLEGTIEKPAFQTRVRKSIWVRSALGGLLRFHVTPGQIVDQGQPLATTESIFGEARSIVIAPSDGIVLGMATHPAAHPGEPICHIAIPRRSIKGIRKAIEQAARNRPMAQVRNQLAANMSVSPSPNSAAYGDSK
ncbi:MAG: succinylglutamate desuccinylase/aspartoacylase family protein [Phycisphaerales bacterium]